MSIFPNERHAIAIERITFRCLMRAPNYILDDINIALHCIDHTPIALRKSFKNFTIQNYIELLKYSSIFENDQ